MKFDPPGASSPSPYHYTDASFQGLQKRFNALVEGGAGIKDREDFIRAAYTGKNRAIRNQDFLKLDPSTVGADYLLPRRDLYFFILENWLRHIFLPSLKPETAGGMLVFGIGRIFSSYNDTGVQRSTDADINIVFRDDLSPARRADVSARLRQLKKTLFEHFKLNLEVDDSFTLLREKEVLARLGSKDGATRLKSLLFYKSNAHSIFIIKDEEGLRSSIFGSVKHLPDALIFENFLGLANPKATFTRILSDRSPLVVLADGSCEKVEVESVIGSRSFGLRWQRLFAPSLHIAPPDWHFSMKYFVNRVYDYVCAMQNLGYSLPAIGFNQVAPGLGADPDYRFLRNAHRMMLWFQELEEIVMRSYNADCDYSYISRARFMRFMEIDGDKFRRDFEDLVLKGDLLLHSEKEAFRGLKAKIQSKSRDRCVTGRVAMLKLLPPAFSYETVFKDKSDFKIRVPYSWSDLGWFVFDSIAARMARIVILKLVPPLADHGMPPGEHRRYLELAKDMVD